MLTEDAAREFLAAHVALDQTWGAHSITVSRAAGQIAAALQVAGERVDPALARTGGLLHDIGRSVTHDLSGHAWAGYQRLLADGEPLLARFCVAHQMGGLAPAEALVIGWPAEDYRPRTWEEKAVTIADGLAMGSRLVLLAERCADVRARYRATTPPAHYALLCRVETKLRALMDDVEAQIGRSVETLCGAAALVP